MDKACPACKQTDHFFVEARCVYRVDDVDVEQHGHVDWDEGSYTRCPCGWFGSWHELVEPPAGPEEKIYTVKVRVSRKDGERHPGEWDWSSLIDAHAEIVSVEEELTNQKGEP